MTARPITAEREKLEPCPWCDPLKAKLVGKVTMMAFGNTPGVERWHGFCGACGAEGPKEATMEAGRAAWNRRSTSASARGMREALEGARLALEAAKIWLFDDSGTPIADETTRVMVNDALAALTSKGERE